MKTKCLDAVNQIYKNHSQPYFSLLSVTETGELRGFARIPHSWA